MAQRHSCSTETLMHLSNLMRDFVSRGAPISPVQAAVSTGNYRLCKQLLAEGGETTTASSVPPPLFLALDMDRYQIARLLIDSGADVFLNHLGMFPMFYALKSNSPEFIVEAIIKAGFPPDSIIEERYCQTALHKAVAVENVNVVKTLLKLNADCNVKETHIGFTPLHIAIEANLPLLVQILVDHGADLEIEDKIGLTPLSLAVFECNLPLVKLLLEAGANVHHFCSDEFSYPLNFAAIMGDVAIVEALLKHGADPSKVAPGTGNLPIHDVAKSTSGKTPDEADSLKGIVELLIQNGSEVDVPQRYGNTPLQLAVQAHNFKVIEVLVKEGAAVNQEFGQGTIFHYIANIANKELVCLFLDYGANHSIVDGDGNTPYHLAIHNHDSSVFSMFWKFGFPFNAPNNSSDESSYPIEVSKQLSSQKLMSWGLNGNEIGLIKRALCLGGSVWCQSVDILYPLHFAVSSGFSAVVLLLLENGLPANIIDDKGESPLHVAARKGYFQTCRYLLLHGACYNLLSKPAGKTPLELALESNHYEIICILREIDDMFKSIAHKSYEELQQTFEKSNNVQSLQAYINSVNREGSTLMSAALKEQNIELAENLMKVRLQIIKA